MASSSCPVVAHRHMRSLGDACPGLWGFIPSRSCFLLRSLGPFHLTAVRKRTLASVSRSLARPFNANVGCTTGEMLSSTGIFAIDWLVSAMSCLGTPSRPHRKSAATDDCDSLTSQPTSGCSSLSELRRSRIDSKIDLSSTHLRSREENRCRRRFRMDGWELFCGTLGQQRFG